MGNYIFKQGDLEPPLRFQLKDQSGPINTAGVPVTIVLKSPTKRMELPCTMTDHEEGIGEHVWLAGETDTPGIYETEFKIHWPGEKPESVPNEEYGRIVIRAKL